MKELTWRLRVSVLWVIDAVAVSAAFAVAFLEPGFLEEIQAGSLEGVEITGGTLVLAAIFWLVPLVMAYLSLVLGRSASRWTAIVLGVILALLNLFDLIGQLGEVGAFGVGRVLLIALMAVVPALIAWHGWKWPTEVA